jgi:DNA modification methylase
MCGDSTKAEDVARLMRGEKADMVFTDPPYAIYGSSSGVGSDVADDKMILPFFYEVVSQHSRNTKDYGHIYICSDWRSWASWWETARRTKITIKNMIVWDKGQGGFGSMYQNNFELIVFASNYTKSGTSMIHRNKEHGERVIHGKGNLWKFDREYTGKHMAQKPVAMAEEAIGNSSDAGEMVIDFFLGSGTTLIAAEKLGRICYGMEIDPKYCDVIIKRYCDYTGTPEETVRATRENPNG